MDGQSSGFRTLPNSLITYASQIYELCHLEHPRQESVKGGQYKISRSDLNRVQFQRKRKAINLGVCAGGMTARVP